MSFDPEFMNLIDTLKAQDRAREAMGKKLTAEAEARGAAARAAEEARRVELRRRSQVTLRAAASLSLLAEERGIAVDIVIGDWPGGRWSRSFVPSLFGWILTQKIEAERRSPGEILRAETQGTFLDDDGVMHEYKYYGEPQLYSGIKGWGPPRDNAPAGHVREEYIKGVEAGEGGGVTMGTRKVLLHYREELRPVTAELLETASASGEYAGTHYEVLLARFAMWRQLLPPNGPSSS